MKYDVHILAVVRVKRTDIEAESQEKAIEKADEATDLNTLFNKGGDGDLSTEWADDIDSFCVDEENDPEYERSCWYDKHGVPL